MSFIADKIVMDGLTYDDVLLIPAYSEVLPRTVDLSTKFSRNIELKIPFVTAAMDTVTEAKMAIAIAREGGIGVIHKNMSIKEQAKQVATVKRAENGMIYDPVTIKQGSTVRDALALMAEYKIGGIPVVDDNRYLVGIVTNRDLRFERNMDKRIDEVMTKENLVTTNQSTDLEAASQILQYHKIEKLPVVDKEGKLIGLVTYKDITKAKDKPMACKDSKGRLRVAAGVGVTADTFDRMQALVDAGADAVHASDAVADCDQSVEDDGPDEQQNNRDHNGDQAGGNCNEALAGEESQPVRHLGVLELVVAGRAHHSGQNADERVASDLLESNVGSGALFEGADCTDDGGAQQLLHHQEADEASQTSGTIVVICQTDCCTDCKQPSHVVDQSAACLDQQEANGVSCTGSCCTGHTHNARSKGIAKTHQDAADRQDRDGKHQCLAQFLEMFHHKTHSSLKNVVVMEAPGCRLSIIA